MCRENVCVFCFLLIVFYVRAFLLNCRIFFAKLFAIVDIIVLLQLSIHSGKARLCGSPFLVGFVASPQALFIVETDVIGAHL